MRDQFYVYILTNKYNKVLYIGITSDLLKRIFEHKQKYVEGFTKKYNVDKLVYYEIFEDVDLAIAREKYLKSKRRQIKIELIEKSNPQWNDLYISL
jgi:putative endonuclease